MVHIGYICKVVQLTPTIENPIMAVEIYIHSQQQDGTWKQYVYQTDVLNLQNAIEKSNAHRPYLYSLVGNVCQFNVTDDEFEIVFNFRLI